MSRSTIGSVVSTVLGLGATTGIASAAPVTGLTIRDVGSNTANAAGAYSASLDGYAGVFKFSPTYLNVQTYSGLFGVFTGDVGTGTLLGGGAANPTGSFSTGFALSGVPFVPFTYGADFVADITNDALNVTSLDFGANYVGQEFFTSPDPGGAFPLEILWLNPTPSAGDYNVAFRWGHDITTTEDPSLEYSVFTAQWVLEGCVSTVGHVGDACGAVLAPVPTTAWLFGSGLAGVAGCARRKRKIEKRQTGRSSQSR
jgi:hypothetical protein